MMEQDTPLDARQKPAAIVLLSGGMDSATAAAMVARDGHRLYGITIDYGQRQIAEIDAAKRVARALKMERHEIVKVDLSSLTGNALTDPRVEVPKQRAVGTMSKVIPETYVPARNIIFASLALAAAESWGAAALVLGVNVVDYSGYPDCRPAFIDAFTKMATLGTKRGAEGNPVRVLTPLITLSKADIVRTAVKLNVPLEHTLSCYDPVAVESSDRTSALLWGACNSCDACLLRAEGFRETAFDDPAQR